MKMIRKTSKIIGGFISLYVMLVAVIATAQTYEPQPLQGKMFGSGSRAIVVFLHGDVSGGGPANYHYGMAEILTALEPNVTAIGLIRPGYQDGQGRRSPGDNLGRRDQYTRANNDFVAQTLLNIRAAFPGVPLIAMGHSGGAAQLGVVIARYPSIVDIAVLVSCPCDIARWRASQNARPYTRSQSPQYYVDRIAPETKVITITGSEDNNTFPALGSDFVARHLENGGIGYDLIVDGSTHWDSALSAAAVNAIRSELTQ